MRRVRARHTPFRATADVEKAAERENARACRGCKVSVQPGLWMRGVRRGRTAVEACLRTVDDMVKNKSVT